MKECGVYLWNDFNDLHAYIRYELDTMIVLVFDIGSQFYHLFNNLLVFFLFFVFFGRKRVKHKAEEKTDEYISRNRIAGSWSLLGEGNLFKASGVMWPR